MGFSWGRCYFDFKDSVEEGPERALRTENATEMAFRIFKFGCTGM